MKKMIIFIILITSISYLNAENQNMRLALQIQQAKKLDQIIKRVNTIYEYINGYIIYTGNIPSNNIKSLETVYGGTIPIEGFDKSQRITYTINSATNLVTFQNVVPSWISSALQQMYRNNIYLHPMAIIGTGLEMNIRLEAKTINFLKYAQTLRELPRLANGVYIGENLNSALTAIVIETCNAGTLGDTWFKADGHGDFGMYICENIALAGAPAVYGWKLRSKDLVAHILVDEDSFTGAGGTDIIKGFNGALGYGRRVDPVTGDIQAIPYIYKAVDLNGNGLYTDTVAGEKETEWIRIP